MKATAIIPCLIYKDAPKAIEWLCTTFNFKKHLIVPGENDTIEHSQLILGDIMVMVSSAQRKSEFADRMKNPAEVHGHVTQSPYVILSEKDLEEHYQNAKKHGANILLELREEDYGGKNYSCYDLEGHLWSFGSYDPWKADEE
ncbi:MAG TPA: VOC family protein [Salinimicrobium sp.]|nr:VOC family protein [Salinimicrobium sp.]